MKYLRLIYIELEKSDGALAGKGLAGADNLEGTSECLAEALKRLPMRVRNGKVSVSDGPFPETKG